MNNFHKISIIVKRKDGYHILSHDKKKHLGGPYSKEKAKKRLRQIEYFKHKKASEEQPKKIYYGIQKISNLKLLDFDKYNSIEIHATKHVIPSKYCFEKWYCETPGGFKFAMQSDKFTNINAFRDKGLYDFNILYKRAAESLKEKLGPIVIIVHPNMLFSNNTCKKFFSSLPKHKYALDIQNPLWYNSVVFNEMAKNNMTFLREYKNDINGIGDWDYYNLYDEAPKCSCGCHEDKDNIHCECENTDEETQINDCDCVDEIYIYKKASTEIKKDRFGDSQEESINDIKPSIHKMLMPPTTMTFDPKNPGPKNFEEGEVKNENVWGSEYGNAMYPTKDNNGKSSFDPKKHLK